MSNTRLPNAERFTQRPFIESPHSGYHWRKPFTFPFGANNQATASAVTNSTRFFEGWYFRVTLPEPSCTFAFMYSIDDPAGGSDYSGGVAQVLGGPHEDYYCRTFPNVETFWAWRDRLGLGHTRNPIKQGASNSPTQYRDRDTFNRDVTEGYQATARHHQGKLLTPAGQVKAQWCYDIEPIASWGGATPKATAGWLSYLPVFEPGWQVLMAHGLATGWIEWRGAERYTFEKAPAYAEKNWGGAFPAKWFWMQCNAFSAAPSLSVTAAAGIREVLMLTENVGLIGIHYEGQFYEFFSTETDFTWAVDPWGYWHLTAQSDRYRVVLTGHATDEGAWVRVPTLTGMQFLCRDTTHGVMRVQLWACDDHAPNVSERLIVDTTSKQAGLEVGGGPWEQRWTSA